MRNIEEYRVAQRAPNGKKAAACKRAKLSHKKNIGGSVCPRGGVGGPAPGRGGKEEKESR